MYDFHYHRPKTLADAVGLLKGKVKVAADFDAPLPADVLSQFEGS